MTDRPSSKPTGSATFAGRPRRRPGSGSAAWGSATPTRRSATSATWPRGPVARVDMAGLAVSSTRSCRAAPTRAWP